MGGVRRVPRQSYRTTFVALTNTVPVLSDNWTTQETTTYNALLPADSPAPWGGTVADLDRAFTAVGSTHTALGALVTFVQKPDQIAGALVKVQATFDPGSACALEVWTLDGATWTKRRRVPIAGLARSGETVILDLTSPVLEADLVDAMWITLAPDIGTETLTWTLLHVYGTCDDDLTFLDCPPATLPEDCDGPECGVDIATWLCLDPPQEPTPGGVPPEPNPPPTSPPFVLPPILVPVLNPTTFVKSGTKYFHDCPRPTLIVMLFGELPSGGSVTVTVANAHGVLFVEGTSQTIAAPGTMTWTVLSGFVAANAGADPSLPPAAVDATTDFFFTRTLDGSAFAVAGNLLGILTYFWTYNIGYSEVC